MGRWHKTRRGPRCDLPLIQARQIAISLFLLLLVGVGDRDQGCQRQGLLTRMPLALPRAASAGLDRPRAHHRGAALQVRLAPWKACPACAGLGLGPAAGRRPAASVRTQPPDAHPCWRCRCRGSPQRSPPPCSSKQSCCLNRHVLAHAWRRGGAGTACRCPVRPPCCSYNERLRLPPTSAAGRPLARPFHWAGHV